MKNTIRTVATILACLSINTSAHSQGTNPKFEAALKKEILSNHQRHVPKVTVTGNEVRLTYGIELEWIGAD